MEKNPPEYEESKDAFRCFEEMLMLLRDGVLLPEEVVDKLASKYSSDILQENSLLLDVRYTLSKIFDIPKPEDCPKCDVCFFKELQDLALKLMEKMAGHCFDQMQLKNLLA